MNQNLIDIDIIDLIESIMSDLNNTLIFDSVVIGSNDEGDNTYTLTGNIKYMLEGGDVIINDITYTATSVDTTAGTFVIDAGETGLDFTNSAIKYKATEMYFYHGTPMQFNKEHGKDLKGNKLKYPCIFLWEPITEALNFDESSIDYSLASLRMIFLDYVDKNNWTVDDYRPTMKRMSSAALQFIKTIELRSDASIDDTQEINKTTHTNWGVVAVNRGHVQSLIDEKVGGVELNNIPFVVKKDYIC